MNTLEAVERLVSHGGPAFVTMETFYPNLPKKALAKYDRVGVVLADQGYELVSRFRDEITGIDYWLFERMDAQAKLERVP